MRDKARIENSKEDLIFRARLKLIIKVRNHLIDEGLDLLELLLFKKAVNNDLSSNLATFHFLNLGSFKKAKFDSIGLPNTTKIVRKARINKFINDHYI